MSSSSSYGVLKGISHSLTNRHQSGSKDSSQTLYLNGTDLIGIRPRMKG